MPLQDKGAGGRYTWADLMKTDESERIELVHGVPYTRTTPTVHQMTLMRIMLPIANYLHEHTEQGELFMGPFCLRPLEKDGDTPETVDTVLEPDLSLICEENKLDYWGCKGPPDLIVEVLAPCTMRHDWFVKRQIYETAGVREYWIVDPEQRCVYVMKLENGAYGEPDLYNGGVIVPVGVLDGFPVDLNAVFNN